MTVIVSDDLSKKLERMRILNTAIREAHADEDNADLDDLGEYGELNSQVVPDLLPLVERMVKAGLFTLYVGGEHIEPDVDMVFFDAEGVFQNGNIWLESVACSGHVPAGKPRLPSEAFMIFCPNKKAYLITDGNCGHGENYHYGEWQDAITFFGGDANAKRCAERATADTGDEHVIERVKVVKQ